MRVDMQLQSMSGVSGLLLGMRDKFAAQSLALFLLNQADIDDMKVVPVVADVEPAYGFALLHNNKEVGFTEMLDVMRMLQCELIVQELLAHRGGPGNGSQLGGASLPVQFT